MSRQSFGGSEPLDLEAIRQSPRQFVDLETVEKLADYAMVCELKIERLDKQRDELLKVLKKADDALAKTQGVWGGTCVWHKDVKDARVAISGVEEGK